MKLMHADTESISPLRLRELEQHEQDNLALRRQQAALLAALDALVAEMRAPHRVRSGTVEGLDAPMIADADRELVAHYWADRLAAELAKHR